VTPKALADAIVRVVEAFERNQRGAWLLFLFVVVVMIAWRY